MQSKFYRCLAIAFASLALSMGIGSPAAADPLLTFTDTDSASGSLGFLSKGGVSFAASWTQTGASSNVTLSALLSGSRAAPGPANWYVTRAIGLGTTAADVLFSGSYSAPVINFLLTDFNGVPRTVLGTGLDFDAGTYYLVLAGPEGPVLNNANWLGETSFSTDLAPGFGLGPLYFTQAASSTFAPDSAYGLHPASGLRLVFEMESVDEGDPNRVPVPPTLALVGLALAALGWTRRQAQRRPRAS